MCCNQFTHVAFLPRMLITGDNQADAECHMFFKTTSLDCSVSWKKKKKKPHKKWATVLK